MFRDFVTSGDNKAALLCLLFETWSSALHDALGGSDGSVVERPLRNPKVAGSRLFSLLGIHSLKVSTL